MQEFLQAKNIPLPIYTVIKTEGKDHEKTFLIKVISQLGEAVGTGQNKRQAEQMAAAKLLNQLEESAS